MRQALMLIGLVLAAVLLAAGCGYDRDGETPHPPSDTAVIAFPGEPDNLNPLLYSSAYAGQILVLLMEGLVEMGEDLQYHPHIADRLDFSPDSLTVTVHLRPWCWSDGVPLTARDVVRSVELYKDPVIASPRSGGRIANIASVTALDSATVRYRFRQVRNDLVATLGHFILPAHVVDRLDPRRVGEWPLNVRPLSSGPYILESWEHGRRLVLVRNERYPDAERRSRLRRLVFRVIPDETARVVALETGETDFLAEVPLHLVDRLARRPDLRVVRLPGRLTGQIYWNLERPLFRDRRVRRALSCAIDPQAIVRGLLHDYGRPAASPLPPALWAHHDSLPPDPYDPALARQLLDAAGWRDSDGDGVREKAGQRLAFTLLTRKGDPVRENGAVLIRRNLAAVGAAVTPRVMELTSAIDLLRKGEFDAYLGVFSARLTVDPSPLLSRDGWDRFNYGHYASARADSILQLALLTRDRARARRLWYRWQEVIAADEPMAFLYYPDLVVAYNRRLRNVRPHILSPYNNVFEWTATAAAPSH